MQHRLTIHLTRAELIQKRKRLSCRHGRTLPAKSLEVTREGGELGIEELSADSTLSGFGADALPIARLRLEYRHQRKGEHREQA